jgi:tRNA1Val (adenine37-N6)-methyltransferase
MAKLGTLSGWHPYRVSKIIQPMSNSYFAFKKFTIYHDKCAMKVGTDGVMLGAWVNVEHSENILDVGTGSGLIAVMIAQRSNAFIDAVEIDENACLQAEENVKACPWNNRITIHHSTFRHFVEYTSTRYDLIVSNPPYFRNSLKPLLKSRSVARHDEQLSYESLLHYTLKLLSPGGHLCLIIPANSIMQIKDLAYFNCLYPSRLLMIRPNPDKEYSRCLIEFTKNKINKCAESEIIIKEKDSNEYTDDFRSLTIEYYLMF